MLSNIQTTSFLWDQKVVNPISAPLAAFPFRDLNHHGVLHIELEDACSARLNSTENEPPSKGFRQCAAAPLLELLGWYVECSSITLKEEGEMQWNHLPRGGVQLFCRPPPPHYHALLCITLSKSTFSCSSQKVRTSWKYILKCEIRCLLSKKN